jgi:predicted outer membrane repeat protein
MLISKTKFLSNSASVNGGGVFIGCDTSTYDCLLELQGSNTFSSNFAGESGGALFWGDVEPTMSLPSITFRQNSAGIYGDNIASIPAKLAVLTEEQYESQRIRASGSKSGNTRRMLSDTIVP